MILAIENLKLRFAFSHQRREAIKTALLLSLVLIGYGIVGSIDHADEQRREADAALTRANLQQAALLACLNGGAPGLYTIDDNGHRHYLVCSRDHYTVSDENTHRKTM